MTVSQNTIVTGERMDVVEVNSTESGTFPFLIWVSKPEIWPPGTINTITAASENIVLRNIA